MQKSTSAWVWLGFFAAGLVMVVLLLASPALYSRVSWRVDRLSVYARSLIDPVEPLDAQEYFRPQSELLPQPRVAVTRRPTETPLVSEVLFRSLTPTPPEPTALPTLTPTRIPGMVSLPAPALEKQDINNCGPASLAMYLRYWGWEGDQFDISDRLKPNRKDRNVNVEELMQYARTRAGWLTSEFRVGGSLELLKRLLAAGLPVMIEEGVLLDETYWANDDHWAAHYLLLTGYDDAAQTFTGQDSFFGANRVVAYQELDHNWKAFNRVFILIYPSDQQATVEAILGPDWDVTINRQRALEGAQAEIEQDPEDAYAWFNQGTNLVFFERYAEAINAFRRANAIGLPQRMLRYQFGPFIANFHNGRPEDLLTLTEYALKRTPNSEEALLWQGWGLYRQGKSSAALQSFQEALSHHPGYEDAEYALEFVRSNP